MRILLTRPIKSSEATAKALISMGHSVEIAPVLEIITVTEQIQPPACNAVVFTSQNAVVALEKLCPNWLSAFKGKIFAVGVQTAQVIENITQAEVIVGGGDVSTLPSLLGDELARGDIVYFPRAKDVRGNLSAKLKEIGINVVSQVVYEARPVACLAEDIINGLLADKFNCIIFYSVRTATIFMELAQKAAIDNMGKATAIAMSADIANQLGAISWAEIKTAEEKTEQALFDCINGDMLG